MIMLVDILKKISVKIKLINLEYRSYPP